MYYGPRICISQCRSSFNDDTRDVMFYEQLLTLNWDGSFIPLSYILTNLITIEKYQVPTVVGIAIIDTFWITDITYEDTQENKKIEIETKRNESYVSRRETFNPRGKDSSQGTRVRFFLRVACYTFDKSCGDLREESLARFISTRRSETKPWGILVGCSLRSSSRRSGVINRSKRIESPWNTSRSIHRRESWRYIRLWNQTFSQWPVTRIAYWSSIVKFRWWPCQKLFTTIVLLRRNFVHDRVYKITTNPFTAAIFDRGWLIVRVYDEPALSSAW